MKPTIEQVMRRNTRRSHGPRCWEWKGHKIGGYGYVRFGGESFRAHRVAWMLANGPIPAGVMVRHLCHNPRCVRPDHLAIGTAMDNTRDTLGLRSMAAQYLLGGRVRTPMKPGKRSLASALRLVMRKKSSRDVRHRVEDFYREVEVR